MPHCPNFTFRNSVSPLRISVLPVSSCQNGETLNKTRTTPQAPDPIQEPLPRLPLPRLETVLPAQVLQRTHLLQPQLLHSRARLPMTIAKLLSSPSSRGSGARYVQTVPPFSFSHISSKYINILIHLLTCQLTFPAVTQKHTRSLTPAAYHQTVLHALQNNEIEIDTKRDTAFKPRAQHNSSVLVIASGV